MNKIFIFIIFLLTVIFRYNCAAEVAENENKEEVFLIRERIIDEMLSNVEKVSFLSGSVNGLLKESAGTEILSLTLKDVIALALKNNLDIVVNSYEPVIEKTLITGEESEFDPSLSLKASEGASRSISSLDTVPRLDEARTYKIGVNQELVSGADYSLDFETNRTHTDYLLNDLKKAHSPSLNLTVSQPLLKNAGIDITKAGIYIARNNRDISISKLKETVISVVSETQKAYWDLVFSLENLKVKKVYLQNAKDLLGINKVKIDAGDMAPLEIVQAQASVASREEDVLLAENAIKDAEDRLKQLINKTEKPEDWDVSILPLDAPPFEIAEVDLNKSLKIAFEKRNDYNQAKIELVNKDIRIKTAKNQMLPTLDLKGSYELNGVSESFSDSMDQAASNDFREWLVALEASFPLGNREAKSAFLKRKLEKAQGISNLKKLEQSIIAEVRSAVRQMYTDIKLVNAAETTRKLQENKLNVEGEKFKAGLSTNFNILKYQEDLMLAQTGYLKAIVNYNKSLAELAKVTGVLLENNNIAVETDQDNTKIR